MFDKKVEHHHHMSEKAAKQMAKAAKAEKRAARIQAEADEEAAYQERKAREAEAKMQLARENPELFMQLKQAEKEETKSSIKIVFSFFLGVFDFLGVASLSERFNMGEFIFVVVITAILILMWYPTIKKHLKS